MCANDESSRDLNTSLQSLESGLFSAFWLIAGEAKMQPDYLMDFYAIHRTGRFIEIS